MQTISGILLIFAAFIFCGSAFSAPNTDAGTSVSATASDQDNPQNPSTQTDAGNNIFLHLNPAVRRMACANCH